MADFDKINIDSVSYNVKDTQARESIETMGESVTTNSLTAVTVKTENFNYKTPTEYNKYFNSVPFTGADNDTHYLLTPGESIDRLGEGSYISVMQYGAAGDGSTDDSGAIQSAINANVGQVIFLPKGTYRLSTTIAIPNGTTIIGTGKGSVLLPDAGVTAMQSTYWGTPTSDSGNYLHIRLERFSIDGGYFSNTNNAWTKSGRTAGSGIRLFGTCFRMRDVTITNCAEYGLYAINAQSPTVSAEREYFFEPVIDNCTIGCCGKDGVYIDYVYDIAIANCAVHTCGQSDVTTNHASGFANIHVEHGNIKMVNSHLSKLYNAVNPRYSLYLSQHCSNSYVSNCHIEGAMSPLYVGADYNMFVNDLFYTSFGQCDVEINAGHCVFSSCGFQTQASESPESLPAWLGAFYFTGGTKCRNIEVINAMLNNCQFSTEEGMQNLGYVNDFIVNGWYGSGDQICAPFNLDKGFVQVHGDFGAQSSYEYMGGTTWTSAWGLPIAKTFYSSYVKMTDEETAASIINITGFTGGNLKLIGINPGQFKIIINNANVSVPWTLEPGVTINDQSTGNFPSKGVYIIVANDATHWYGYIGG